MTRFGLLLVITTGTLLLTAPGPQPDDGETTGDVAVTAAAELSGDDPAAEEETVEVAVAAVADAPAGGDPDLSDPDDSAGEDPGASPVPVAWAGRARVTAYAPGCGDSGLTAVGSRPGFGTVAVDPRVIPLYSLLEIEGLPGIYHALDTGGGVRGQHIDLWMPTCSQARQWGSQQRAYRVVR